MNKPAEDTGQTAQQHAAAMKEYIANGERAAQTLGNRGPVQFGENGKLHPDILAAYWRCGFYVFEGVVDDTELADLRQDVDQLLERAPVEPEGKLDCKGRPAFGSEYTKPPFRYAEPLSDPLGGTALNNGRHPVKMQDPKASSEAPKWTIHFLDGNLQLMDSCLRLYGHPHILKIAEAVTGPDFAPYNEVTFIKEPGLGPSVAWHRDGTNHWTSPDWNEGAHGFNTMTQLYDSTAANCVWVLPGSHKFKRVDIKKLVEDSGSERIEGAVPMACKAGDVLIMNRQLMHGSFANTSQDRRVTLNAGFFPRKRVLNVTAIKLNGSTETYTPDRVHQRSRIIALAIDARQQRYPDEPRYHYQPLAGQENENRWTPENREKLLKNYNLQDMFI